MEQIIIFFIFIIFFVLGPLLKKILESLEDGYSPKPQKASRDEVKEYLERMRGKSQSQQKSSQTRYGTQPKQYRAPSTEHIKPKAYQEASNIPPQKHKEPEREPEIPILEVSALEAQEKPKVHEVAPKPVVPPKKKGEKAILLLNKQVMANPRFTDLQKMVILYEIFNKPKSMSKGLI